MKTILLLACLLLTLPTALAAVGRTPGAATVTAEGVAAYRIPLRLPPGTAGMTPVLSLEYRHSSHGGLVGVGWTVGGLSGITRCARTIVQDGAAGPATLDSTSRYCLDGQRLVVSNGATYGSNQAEYRTEIESFSRIRPFGTSGFGPQHFVVEGRDGLIREYGATAGSRIEGSLIYGTPSIRVWALSRVRDRSGNVIDFSYTKDTNNKSHRISTIAYNSNSGAGVTASHVVSFLYENRPANEVDLAYIQGTPIRQIARLKRIDALYNNAVVRRYDLAYQGSLSTGGRSRLASVTECGVGGSDCLAPTIVTWQDGTPGLGQAAALPAVGWPVYTPDINGDGRSDLAWAGGAPGQATIRYRLSLASGGFGAEIDTRVAGGMRQAQLDQNGDGFDDIAIWSSGNQVQLMRGSTTGLGGPINTGLTVQSAHDIRGADMNGDGLDDLATSEPWSAYDPTIAVRVRYAIAGGTFSATPVTLYEQMTEMWGVALGGNFLGRPGQQVDVDGDGRDDLFLNEDYSVAVISADQASVEKFDGSFAGGSPADINGDGCTDFVYAHYTGSWRVRFSSCQTFLGAPELSGPPAASPYVTVIDWNGDRKDDVMFPGANGRWQVMVSTGAALLPAIDTGVPYDPNHAVADFNGDRLHDLVTGSTYRLHAGLEPDLVLAVTDGFGVAAAFAYGPLTDDAVHTRSTGATYPDRDIQDGRTVVTRLTVTDGSGTGATTSSSFFYEGLRYSATGRGNLGFARKTAIDNTLGYGTRTEESYRQDYPFIGLPRQVTVRQSAGPATRETVNDWAALSFGSGYTTRRLPYVSQSTDRHFEVGGAYNGTHHTTISLTTGAIEASSGLATDTTTTVTEVATGMNPASSWSERRVHGSVLNDTANWCLGRPQTTQVITSHTLPGGAPVTRTVGQTWDGLKCRPTQHQLEPGHGQLQATVALAYDSFGNISSRSVTGIGMATRSTTYSWGTRGQFPVTVTNALAQGTTQAWRYDLGLPVSETDPNGLVSSWAYDNFGRKTLEVNPDLNRVSWNRVACSSGGCDTRTRYQQYQLEMDAAGAVYRTTTAEVDQFERAFRTTTQMPGGGHSVSTTDSDARGRPLRRHLPHWSGGAPGGYLQTSYDLLDRITGEALHSAGGGLDRQSTISYAGLATTFMNPRNHSATETRSAWGNVMRMTDQGGNSTHYQYDGPGQVTRVTDAAGNTVSQIEHDVRGHKISQTDLDLGKWTFVHNALGELVAQTDAKNQVTGFTYDSLGRMTRRNEPDGTSNWAFGTSAASRNIGQLVSVSGPGYAESWTYDGYSRPSIRSITTDATYQYSLSYNSLGRPDTLTYPASTSGYRLKLAYEYANGYLSRIRDANAPATVLWQLNATDAAGNVIDESLGNGIKVVTGFSPLTGAMENRQAGPGGGAAIQNAAYQWDGNANLTQRRDMNRNLTEDFQYDGLDRLSNSRLNGAVNLSMAYDAIGNITSKTSLTNPAEHVGGYTYHPVRRHAVVTAGNQTLAYDANGNATSRNGGAISWYSYNLPSAINQPGGNHSQFWHGPERNRWKQVASHAGSIETTTYIGDLMEKVTRGAVTGYRHYIDAPTGVAAIYLRSSGASPSEATYYLTHDHLGNIDKILNAAGVVVSVAESFDAYGRRRASTTWTGNPSAADLVAIGNTTRDGFTGHEHLDNLNLIHMNGRVYDPVVGRFLSADPYVQSPYYSQSLNRYSYVWNNPLSYTDPSGFQARNIPPDQPQQWCVDSDVCYNWNGVSFSLSFGWTSAQSRLLGNVDSCSQDGSFEACVIRPRMTSLSVSRTVDVASGPRTESGGDAVVRQVGMELLNAVPGWYYSGQAVDAASRGEYLLSVAFFGATTADFLTLGRGSLATEFTRTSIGWIGRGVTVLGHHPGYDTYAIGIGARYFRSIPRDIRIRMGRDGLRAANMKFLDRIITRGDIVHLSTPATHARAGSTFAWELEYMTSRGYALSDDGMRLLPPVP